MLGTTHRLKIFVYTRTIPELNSRKLLIQVYTTTKKQVIAIKSTGTL